MPMPPIRRWHRGIDHAGVIAEGVARVLDSEVVRPLRRRGTVVQAARSGIERRSAAGLGLAVGSPPRRWSQRLFGGRNRWIDWGLEDRLVVLVDDVRTTGATLQAAVARVATMRPRAVIVAVVAVSEGAVGRIAAGMDARRSAGPTDPPAGSDSERTTESE